MVPSACLEQCCLSSLSASSSAVGAYALPEWSECCKLWKKSVLILETRGEPTFEGQYASADVLPDVVPDVPPEVPPDVLPDVPPDMPPDMPLTYPKRVLACGSTNY